MQQVQTTILNKIQPGVNPIFIISPDINDGDALALLLSNSLIVSGSSLHANQVSNRNKNYFSTAETQHLFNIVENNKFRNAQEDRDKIDFIFSSDFDNGILWGLQSSYQAFFQLDLHNLYKNAFYFILYGTPIAQTMKGASEHELLNKAYSFYEEHHENAILLHVNNTNYLEQLILQLSPVNLRTLRAYPATNNLLTPDKNLHLIPAPAKGKELIELYKKFNQENFIAKSDAWYKGNDILVILIINYISFEDLLAKKIQQLAMSFLSYPTIYIACKSKEQHDAIKKTIQEHYADININITICDNFIPVLNKIIADTTCTKIVIDNLNLSYSFFQILSPFKNQEPPVFNYGSVLADKIINISSGKLLLVDILTTRILLDNLAFEKSTWIKINGFDPSIADEVMIWDFCIRALIPANSYALESPAALVSQKKNENQIIDDSNYSAVIEKHKNLYGANLNQVLKLVSENQYIPQNEIFNLNSKITSLDVFLKHSKDEVKSLNEFSSSLQNRIRTLESSRFYKWSERIKHYKKIFFKEKKPGRGILKSIIKFILFIFSKAGFGIFRTVLKRIFLKLYSITEPKPFKIIYLETNNAKTSLGAKYFLSYNDWITSKLEYDVIKKEYDSYADLMMLKPKISVIMPVYNPSVNFLKEAIDSVINQLYDNWELCIADDCSPNPQIKRLLNSYSLRDERIKVNFRTENGHISACSNSALELTTGDYIMLMDHDDLLTQNCMFEFVKHLNTFPNHQLIYSDEDKVQDGVFSDPFFKPDYSPDKLLATNYISHVVLIDKKIMDKVQGFHLGFEGSQDFDLMLRCAEQTDKIGHISKILYHWRIHEMSVAGGAEAKPYAYIAAKKAISEALIRRHTPGEVSFQLSRGYYRIAYDVKHYSKVSIIIPTKDAFKLTKNTIDSILKFTEYPNYEIIVLNNNSVSKDFYALMDKYKAEYSDKFMCVDANFPFNFSKLINLGVSKSTGKYILMLNNDVEIIQKDWLTTMVSYSQHKTTGAVGVKLLYPDDRIQHAGVIIGLGNIRIAGHPFVNHYKDDHGYFNYIQTTDNYSAVTAACLMCRKEIFEEVGGMDETLEVEYNDIDFCLKLVDRGYYNVYLPEVTLYHYESSTRDHPFQNKVAYQRHLKEVDYFKNKWIKYILNDPFYNPNLSLNGNGFEMDFSTEKKTEFSDIADSSL